MFPLGLAFSTLLERNSGVAVEDADGAGAVQIQCPGVAHVRAKIAGRVPGDATGVFDGHGAAPVVVDAAAAAVGGVVGKGAVGDGERSAGVVDAAAVAVAPGIIGVPGGVAGKGAVADRHRPGVVVDAAAESGAVAREGAVANCHRPADVVNAAAGEGVIAG